MTLVVLTWIIVLSALIIALIILIARSGKGGSELPSTQIQSESKEPQNVEANTQPEETLNIPESSPSTEENQPSETPVENISQEESENKSDSQNV